MKKLFILLTVLAAGLLFFWYKKTTQPEPVYKTLIVGTSADFPPFSFRNEHDEIVGFDIDVIKEVAKRINLDTQLEDRLFNVLLSQMQAGQMHVIAAGLTPSPERAKAVNFTKPYLTGNPLLVLTPATTASVSSLEDLKNKKVIVVTGYNSDIYMSKLSGINLIRLDKIADAFATLEKGGNDYAFVTEGFTVRPYLKKYGLDQNKFNIFRISETDENTALAIAKTLPEKLFNQIQKALDDMQEDGTLDALKQKWEVF